MNEQPQWLICPHCGEPVEGASNDPDQFETPEDMEGAGPVYHAECVHEAMRSRPSSSRVYFYDTADGGEVGPLTREA